LVNSGKLLRLRKQYIIPTILLFLIELCIALFVDDDFVRPYLGDFLVVIFLYCFLSCFLDVDHRKLAAGVLIYAYLVEITQYYNLIDKLGLQHSWLANIILGSGFEWFDLLAYTLGIGLVLLVEMRRRNPSSPEDE
jgi:hypothetical protein